MTDKVDMDIMFDGTCPDCGGEIDEAFECNSCGKDWFVVYQDYFINIPEDV